MRLSDLDLPDGFVEHYENEVGVEELYPPQEEAVEAGVVEGDNVVAAVPTASGKTLIAAMAMASNRKALYVVPLRALASEKYEEFREIPGLDVGVSTGDYDSDESYLADNDVVVATSEKVDSLVRNGADWIKEVDCVVVDEVHLLDSGDRGPTLEVTIAKLRRLGDPQVVALSATVDNAGEIAGWLDAELVDSDWRPVDLRRGVYTGEEIRYRDPDERDGVATEPVDGDGVAALAAEAVEDGGQCLVFVNSRRSAESVARQLSREGFGNAGETALTVRDAADTSTGDDLADCLEGGVAFHHAGLKNEHRTAVEDSFRSRETQVIAATPTLAAGVNVPARRVVVRDFMRYTDGGMRPLPVLEVHQMFGRAGRPGLDPYGEAVVVAEENPDEVYEEYILGEPEPVYSKLANQQALRTHLLATVASGFARSHEEVLEFLEATFYSHQEEGMGIEGVVDDTLDYLHEVDMVERRETDEDVQLSATDLGHAVSRLYIDPMSAARMVEKLEKLEEEAEDGFEPSALSFLEIACHTPDMYTLYLGRDDDTVGYAMEHEDEFVDPPSEFERGFEDWLAAVKTARVLVDWTRERDVDEIAERHDVDPGDVNTRVERADWLLYALEELAAHVDSSHRRTLHETRQRVQHGVRDELLSLVGIHGVGRVRARRLYEAGIESEEDVAEADVDRLARLLGPKTAVNVFEEVGREVREADVDDDAEFVESKQATMGDF